MTVSTRDAEQVTGTLVGGIAIFREVVGRQSSDDHTMENRSSDVAIQGMAQMMEAGLSDAYVMKCLYRSPDPDGMSLLYAWFKGNYPLPPHTHDADCLYYIVSGSIRMGAEELTAGDGFFVPANTVYSYTGGPDGVEVLEFRNASQFDIVFRDGSPRAWDRMVEACLANREMWKNQPPPTRIARV